jgi:hypothetical protein
MEGLLEDHNMAFAGSRPAEVRDRAEAGPTAVDEFPPVIKALLDEHRPSRMPFFQNLAGLPYAVASDPSLLGQIHLHYQSAMHATRAAVYYPTSTVPRCASESCRYYSMMMVCREAILTIIN